MRAVGECAQLAFRRLDPLATEAFIVDGSPVSVVLVAFITAGVDETLHADWFVAADTGTVGSRAGAERWLGGNPF